LKKPTGSVRFRFFKPGTGKTEPNRTEKKQKKTEPNRKNRAKTEKTKPNRFEPVFSLQNRTETGRFEPVLVFLKKKKFGLIIFFYKNRTVNTPSSP